MAWNPNEPGNPAWLTKSASMNGGVSQFLEKTRQEGFKAGRRKVAIAFVIGVAVGCVATIAALSVKKYLLKKKKVVDEVAIPETLSTTMSEKIEDDDETDEEYDRNMLKKELYRIHVPNEYLTNVKLEFDGEKAEIDTVIFSPHGIFMIEINRSRKDSFLCENAQVPNDPNYNIDEKMERNERLLRKALEKVNPNLKIIKVVLFQSPYLDVIFSNKDIEACPFNCLADFIESAPDDRYSEYEYRKLYEFLRRR